MYIQLFLFLIAFFIRYSSMQENICADDHFKCNDGRCIMNNWICDGARDCPDGSDEAHEACDKHHQRNSPCFGNQPECEKHGSLRCIPHEWLCDGHPDCDKGEDEVNCTTVHWFRPPENLIEKFHRKGLPKEPISETYCKYGEFQCGGAGECIKRDKLCDKKSDCKDNSDEKNCPVDPSPNRNTTNEPKEIAERGREEIPTKPKSSSTIPVTFPKTSTKMILKPTEQPRKPESAPPIISTVTKPTQKTILSTTRGIPKVAELRTTTIGSPPTLNTTKPPKGLIFTIPRKLSTTTTATLITQKSKEIEPHLKKAVQPPMKTKSEPETTNLPYTPIMALLFVTPSTNSTSHIISIEKPIEPEVLENFLRDSRSTQKSTKMDPVKYYKGVPIDPINLNITENSLERF